MGILNNIKKMLNNSDFKKSEGTINIMAPISGKVINIEDVPDVVFAEKIVGDGVAIQPNDNKLVAPIDGTIEQIFETNYAFSITSKQGITMFVHYGIDTIELKGVGFTRVAKAGDSVKCGDIIIELDQEFLEKNAKSTLTPVVISNMEMIKSLKPNYSQVQAGITPIMNIKL